MLSRFGSRAFGLGSHVQVFDSNSDEWGLSLLENLVEA